MMQLPKLTPLNTAAATITTTRTLQTIDIIAIRAPPLYLRQKGSADLLYNFQAVQATRNTKNALHGSASRPSTLSKHVQ